MTDVLKYLEVVNNRRGSPT